jgi:uncharacterized damage-inducible protein DinB
MNRKDALKKLAGAGVLMSMPLISYPQPHSSAAELDDFLQRWEVSKGYSLKILEKMPEEELSFQPTPEQMSFGKQFTHAGYWNTFYAGILAEKLPLEEPPLDSKSVVTNYVAQTFDYCTNIFRNLTDEALNRKGMGEGDYWQAHTGRDFLLRAYAHTAHHRAQAIVYLRLKGFEPPFFEF